MKVENIAEKLILIPSFPVNKDGKKNVSGEEALAVFIENFLKKARPELKMKKQIVKGRRYNMVFSSRPLSESRLIFCCHMDTVPAKALQVGKNGNLKVNIVQDRVYGLGSVDMKGGIATLLSALEELEKPTEGLAIIFYCDEEFGFLGMKKLTEELEVKAPLAIFCEPTNLKISNGCRGLIEFCGYIKGKTAHASRPEDGRNAIFIADDAFKDFKTRIKSYENLDFGNSVCNLAGLNGGLAVKNDKGDTSIEYSGNNVPNIAYTVIEARTTEAVLNSKRAIALFKKSVEREGGTFQLDKIKHDYSAFFTPPIKLKKLEKAINEAGESVLYQDLSNTGYYDAEMFSRNFSISSISFGPSPTEKSHAEDEYVSIKSLNKTKKVYKKIMENYKVL